MRKLTTNMEEVLQCITNEYTRFGEICNKFGQLQKEKHNRNSSGYVWKSLVDRTINSLIKKKLVEYGSRGKYRKTQPSSHSKIKIWDSHHKQWLEPMSIFFGEDGLIWKVCAKKPGDNPLSDGWYDFQSDDLDKIAIIGEIKMNEHLIPNLEN